MVFLSEIVESINTDVQRTGWAVQQPCSVTVGL